MGVARYHMGLGILDRDVLERCGVGEARDRTEQPNARPMASILDLFDGKAIGADLPAAHGTAWGLVNAATQYYDHRAGRSANSRLSSAWFGPASASRRGAAAGLLDDVLSATTLA